MTVELTGLREVTHALFLFSILFAFSPATFFNGRDSIMLNAKFQIGERTGKKADPAEVSKATRTAKDIKGRDYLTMGIFSQASKLAVTSLVLLLSELSRQISMIVRTRLQEKTFRVYLVTRFCLKSAFSIHIQSDMTPTTSVS